MARDQDATLSVPIIDIAEIESEDALRAIDLACREWGFFQVVGHGIGKDVTAGLFDAAHAFFEQSSEIKRGILRTEENPWGFYDQELTKNTLDWKEVFDFGPADGEHRPRWPSEQPEFEPAVNAFYRACESLAHRILAAISINLGMPADHLSADFRQQHTSFLRLNYYPSLPPDRVQDTDQSFGVNEHSDAGALTLLLQDAQAGLEVCRDDVWHLVEPVDDALVINIGDMVQVWSNDRYRAALHRVVTNTEHARFSAPFFFNPRWETNYKPLPSAVDAENPPRYRAINWREFRTLRHAGDYADYGDEVQIADYRI